MPRLCSSLLLSLLIASSASAVSMNWTPIGNPGNACDPQPDNGFGGGCFGSVGYAYSIGTYEITNAQYAEFLNTKAASDPLGLYHTSMGSGHGGISQIGSSGSYTYSARFGREDMPVNFVSFYDALRFANWMNNGQGNGDTETGAYTLLGGTFIPSNGTTVTRNAGATIVLSSEDEWFKAAYYDSSSSSYYDYPAGSNIQTTCAAPSATPNTANCSNAIADVTSAGSYIGSASPYGTRDQGGNVHEWNETISPSLGNRGIRGGSFSSASSALAASVRRTIPPRENSTVGFRLAMIPEPGTGLLVIAGLLSFAGCRRGRA